MKVLVTTIPAWGHLVPMLGIVRALERAGHEVLVATSPDFHAELASLDLRPFSAGLSEHAMLAERRMRWPSTMGRPPREWARRMFTEIAAPAMATDLAPLVDAGWPDLILSEEGEYGGRLVAESSGVPVVTHGWGTPAPPPAPGFADVPHIDTCPPSMAGSSAPAGWRLRYEVPTLVTPSPELTSWIEERKRPLAYVGFGTVPLYRDRADVTQAMGALHGTGFDTVCTVKDPDDPALAAAAAGWGARLEKFLSLPDLLSHCAVVVSHGGAGTTMAALAHGVPLLIMPQGAPSQQRMADACTARGVARCLSPDDSTHDRLRESLQALIDDTAYSTEAAAVAEEIAAGTAPEIVVDGLVAFAASPTS
ncbi:MAG: glycosyltransferase [Frankiales bacterium]|nr:glycosyltransferase [Frankiales bacterium]